MNATSVGSSPAHNWYTAHDIETSPIWPRRPGSIISRPTSAASMSRRPSKRSIENASQSFAGTSPGPQWRMRAVPVSWPAPSPVVSMV